MGAVHAVVHAIGVFFDQLAAVHWAPLGLAVACQLVKGLVATRAWRNVVAAAYPQSRVSWPRLYGAWIAGAAVNAILPARGGDAVKFYLTKHRVEGSTYTTLASTVILLTLFDMLLAGALVIWAIAIGVLPGLDVLPSLPSFDFGWLVAHPRLGLAIAIGFFLLVLSLVGWVAIRIEQFWQRVRQGFAILHDRPRYLRSVALLQLCEWCLRVATIFFFLRAFSIEATVHNALLVQVTESLATIFPFSPGGIGTTQALLLYVLRGQAGRTALLSFSVGMKVTLTVVNVVIGFAAMLVLLRTLRFRRALAADPVEGRRI